MIDEKSKSFSCNWCVCFIYYVCVMEAKQALEKIHSIILAHIDDFDTSELLHITECLWTIDIELS